MLGCVKQEHLTANENTHPKKKKRFVRFVNTRQPITTVWVKQWWIFCQRHRGFWGSTKCLRHFRNTNPNIWDIWNTKQKRQKTLKRSVGNGIFQTKDCFKSQLMNASVSICTVHIHCSKAVSWTKTWGNRYTYNLSLTIRHKTHKRCICKNIKEKENQ